MRTGDTGIEKRVVVGIVLKTVGLKGEVKIKPLTDNPERYRAGATVWAEPGKAEGTRGAEGGRARLTRRAGAGLPAPSAAVPLTVKSVRDAGRDLAVFFEEVGTVEEAEGLRGKELFVPESEVPPLPEGEYYQFQVLGLEVYTSGGRLLGKVGDIIEAGGKDVYVVKGAGKEYLIPVIDDAIERIDVRGGRITLRPMKGYIPE
ncbi:MAG: ribosome maturation factor RimM [Nitrospirota bacterium]